MAIRRGAQEPRRRLSPVRLSSRYAVINAALASGSPRRSKIATHPNPSTVKREQTWTLQERFLAAYAIKGTIRQAVLSANVDRSTVWAWSKADVQGFVARFHEAELEFRDKVQDIMLERIEEPEGNRGSDGLLSHLANAVWPEKFRDRPPPSDDTQKQIAESLQILAKQDRKQIAEARVIEGEVKVVEVEGNR